MVHYYYYVSAGAQCDESTRIWKVAVGTSKQCKRDYAFLVAHVLLHGHYFEVVLSRYDEFVKRLRHSLVQFNVQLEWLSCRDLCRELRQMAAIKGKFMLSNYPSEIISKFSAEMHWSTRQIFFKKNSCLVHDRKSQKTEVLLMNYHLSVPQQLEIFQI